MNREEFKKVFKLSSLYIAATIGAGFASGKELFIYFTNHKEQGKYGLILAGVLFVVLGFILIDYIRLVRPANINELFKELFGSKLSLVLNSITLFFLAGVFSIMLSGMANIITEFLVLNHYISSVLIAFICYFILIFGIEAIVRLSQFVTPFLLLGIYFLCFLLLRTSSVQTSTLVQSSWPISTVNYISYNILISVVVLIDAKYLITSKKISLLSAFIGGIGLFSTSYLINLTLLANSPTIALEELPMLALAKNVNYLFFLVWSIILFFAMLTTAVSAAQGFIKPIIPKLPLSPNVVILSFLAIALQLSYIGFTNLINFFYPLYGYIGIVLLILLIINYVKLKI